MNIRVFRITLFAAGLAVLASSTVFGQTRRQVIHDPLGAVM